MDTASTLVSLMRGHQARVWAYLRLLGCDPALADDLTQETFLTVMRKGFEERDERATTAYLRGVARFLYLRDRRAQARSKEVRAGDLLINVAAADDAAADAVDRVWEKYAQGEDDADAVAFLRECMELLEGRAREVVEACYRDQLSGEEIAGRLGTTLDGVKSLLKRTKRNLRECVERKLGRQDDGAGDGPVPYWEST